MVDSVVPRLDGIAKMSDWIDELNCCATIELSFETVDSDVALEMLMVVTGAGSLVAVTVGVIWDVNRIEDIAKSTSCEEVENRGVEVTTVNNSLVVGILVSVDGEIVVAGGFVNVVDGEIISEREGKEVEDTAESTPIEVVGENREVEVTEIGWLTVGVPRIVVNAGNVGGTGGGGGLVTVREIGTRKETDASMTVDLVIDTTEKLVCNLLIVLENRRSDGRKDVVTTSNKLLSTDVVALDTNECITSSLTGKVFTETIFVDCTGDTTLV